MLGSVHHAVIAASDPDRMVAFLGAMGFADTGRATLETEVTRALYGTDSPADEVLLVAPGAPQGSIRVVSAPITGQPPVHYGLGPTAIDLYTTDMRRSIEVARKAGAVCGPIGTYPAGPALIAEARVIGPDGVAVVFIEMEARRPSMLDRSPDRLHSEVHSVVWGVEDVDGAATFWHRAGHGVVADLTISHAEVGAFLGLPEPLTPVRLQLLADRDCVPARLELLTYEGVAMPPDIHDGLRGGLHAVAFLWADVDRPPVGAEYRPVVAVDGVLGKGRVRAGVAPGGVRFELWETA